MLSDFAKWLLDMVLWAPKKLWQSMLEGLSALIAAIPVPEFVSTAHSAFSSISGNVLFFAHFFAVKEGVAMVLGAYVLRFAIRRIPLVG
jgi:hypothetical protein